MKKPYLIVICCSIMILACLTIWSCSKGNDFFNENIETPSTQNFPIDIAEAKSFFQNATQSSGSFDPGIQIIDLTPIWEEAYTDYSQSGHEMIVVPLPDSSLCALNNGMAGAKLAFSKKANQTINVNLIVYLADSTYHDQTNGVYAFSSFTGVYAFYDIGQHFKYALYVQNGEMKGVTDSITQITNQIVDDRNLTLIERTLTYYNSNVNWDSELKCQQLIRVYLDGTGAGPFIDPHNNNNGSNPGEGGGSGSGNPTSGGGGSGNNNGNNPVNNWDEEISWMDVFTNDIPTNVFLDHDGTLPPGTSIMEFKHLVELNNICGFSQDQIQYIVDNDETEALYTFFYTIGNTAPNRQFMREIVDLMETYDLSFLTVSDLEALRNTPDLLDRYSEALQQNPNWEKDEKLFNLRMVYFGGPDLPYYDLVEKLKCFDVANNSSSDIKHFITIFVDQPIENSSECCDMRYSYGHAYEVGGGHTWFSLTQQNLLTGTVKSLNIGLFPQSIVTPYSPFSTSPGVFNDDAGRVGDVVRVLEVSNSKFNEIVNYLSENYSSPPEFDLNNFNCTTFTTDVLVKNHIDVPQNPVSFSSHGGYGLCPGKFGQDLKNYTGTPDGVIKNSGWFIGGPCPSSEMCN